MTPLDFVISLIAGFGGQIQGRTLLQKRAYFVARLCAVSVELGYEAHYYGPYSAVVDNTVTRLMSLGFVTEENTGFGVASSGFEIRRYDYHLTRDGQGILAAIEEEFRVRIERACHAIINAGDPNYFVISVASKADFILGKRGQAMTRKEIIREAQKFDWNIQSETLNGAIDFLEKVGLAQMAAEAAS